MTVAAPSALTVATLPTPGDPARIVASGERAARDLGWQMRHMLADMVDSAWQARRLLG